jgi:hypothetical protein
MTKYSVYEANRNLRSQARDSLIAFINMISISGMDSLRTQAGMLSMLTSQTDEITRNSEVQFIKIYVFFFQKPFKLNPYLKKGHHYESVYTINE